LQKSWPRKFSKPKEPKYTYLEKISQEYNANILCLQETHIAEIAHPDRFKLQGFQLVYHDDQPKHRTSIYIRKGFSPYHTSVTLVNVGDIIILNIYKPSNTKWEDGSLPTSVILGDFNRYNTLWGYAIMDEAGKALEE